MICLAPLDNISEVSESRLKSIGAQVSFIHIARKSINPAKDIIYLIRLIKLLRKLSPAVVLNYTPKPNIYGSLACQFLKIHYINTINGLGSGFLSGFPVANIMKRLYKIALRKSKQVFIQNRDDLGYFLNAKLTPGYVTSLIPGSGIDLSEFQHKGKRRPNPGALIFLFVGRLNKEKGVYDFVYLADQLKGKYPECEFWMVGFIDEGNPSALSIKELNRLSASGVIEYKGKTDNVLKYLNEADIMVFPSEREGLPRTLLEAASCCMPIVAYDVPGCREVVSDGFNGYLCNPGDKEHLTDVCDKLLNMQQLDLVRLGTNGREKVRENFTIDIVNNQYISCLEQLFQDL